MLTQSGQNDGRRNSISAKAAYSKAAQKRLIDSKTRLDGVKAKIRNAVTTGRIDSSEQLKRAQLAVEANLKTAEARLERLRKSGEENWEDHRVDMDTAWEDLAQSIKKLVTRFSDGSK